MTDTRSFDVALPPDSTVRIVGLGGIGQPVAIYLARFLANLRQQVRMVLIDGDAYEPDNAGRMEVPEVYRNKADAMQAQLARRHGGSTLGVLAVPEYLTPHNIDRLIPSGPGESVLVCVDNHASRKLVAEHARSLRDVVIVSGGNEGVGADSRGIERHGLAGNVQVYVRRDGANETVDPLKYHPEIANPPDQRPDEVGCAELAVSTPQIMFTNLFAASCMLSTWWLHWCGRLDYWEVVFKRDRGRMAPILPIVDAGAAASP